ncbi:tRNA nucleotidyltransferase/poly(A) polymerase family protein [Aliarcobacter cryaerophilus]|uniref:CCA tRNA nucleotidyltransferase n=1 Tax=Aliarcobacter cryaerophilus TaxID=28198 RepID=UPI0021B5F85D|nr:CCA tRNA nucleotidyltransferase [Aliarcobacter cryaerophilus]MCT7496658.1 CCA tRNA nucleotidyltransferase [Aliarcobacter cryaerophilus]
MFITITKIKIPKILENIFEDLKSKQAKPIVVGGCVRDSFLNKEIKDYDIEVYNIDSIDSLKSVISKYKEPKLVGKSFGVLKLSVDDFDFDFSLPRTEIKTGFKHRDFIVSLDSNLSYKEASRRRDFTINSIGYDYFENRFLDPFGGIKDLKKRKIRYIDKKSFVEDSLRVFRAFGFASRFDFKITKKTKQLLKTIIKSGELNNLSKERVFEELKKLLLKSKKPSVGLKLLDEFKIFKISFVKKYKAIDKLSKIFENRDIDLKRALVLYFVVLLKDEKEEYVFEFLSKISSDKKFINSVISLCKESLENDIISLKKQSLNIVLEDLILVEMAFGKKDIDLILQKCEESDILNKALKPHIMGVDLLDLGFTPSCDFKNMLNFAMDLQIEENLSKDELRGRIMKSFIK